MLHSHKSVFFTDTAPTEFYPLSLHDALPIWIPRSHTARPPGGSTRRMTPAHPIASSTAPTIRKRVTAPVTAVACAGSLRSEEHTSELQSHVNLVCRLLLEKKKNTNKQQSNTQ